MKPRILIYSTAYYPLVGGAEVAIKEITDRLGGRYDFDLVTAQIKGGLPKIEQIGQVRVFRLGFGLLLDKFWLALVGGNFGRRLHRKNPYQAVWAMMASYGGFAASDFKVKEKSVPYLLTLQEGDDLVEIERKVRFIKSYWQNIFKRANYIQCISHYLALWAKRQGVLAPVAVVPNGVDLDSVALPITKIEPTKQADEKVIITTSRLVKKNGLADLIRSLSLIPKETKLWILGLGPEEPALKKLALELGVAGRVTWLGFVDNKRLFSYLKEADVFVRPSLTEGLGNSFLEAMAVGLPTVGTAVGGIVDFLKAGETGWLVKVRNPESIALAINFILNPANKLAVETISRQGENLVHTRYDWKIVALTMREIFEKLIYGEKQKESQ